jgi:hypothetical protein
VVATTSIRFGKMAEVLLINKRRFSKEEKISKGDIK